MNNNRCVACGRIIPEGWMVCTDCDSIEMKRFTNRKEGRNFMNASIQKETSMRFNRTLEKNGWIRVGESAARIFHPKGEKSEYILQTCTESGIYCNIHAYIVESATQLDKNGKYGVSWVEVSEASNATKFNCEELYELQQAIADGESNLLAIGIPFVQDYDFHSDSVYNREEKAVKNKDIRDEWNLNEIENYFERKTK